MDKDELKEYIEGRLLYLDSLLDSENEDAIYAASNQIHELVLLCNHFNIE